AGRGVPRTRMVTVVAGQEVENRVVPWLMRGRDLRAMGEQQLEHVAVIALSRVIRRFPVVGLRAVLEQQLHEPGMSVLAGAVQHGQWAGLAARQRRECVRVGSLFEQPPSDRDAGLAMRLVDVEQWGSREAVERRPAVLSKFGGRQ